MIGLITWFNYTVLFPVFNFQLDYTLAHWIQRDFQNSFFLLLILGNYNKKNWYSPLHIMFSGKGQWSVQEETESGREH